MVLKRFWGGTVKTTPASPAAVPAAIPAAQDGPPPCYPPGSAAFNLTAESLAAWAKSPEFRSVYALARTYDAYDSLQSDNSRAFLYHLIMTQRPQRVLEIGTFRAGTARFLAQALHHAKCGMLYTIDPFGIENNVPATIASWPAYLQERVRFSPISSAAFFDQAMIDGLMFDMVLIDGNHEYEYAAFDLACSARLMNAGGIAVLDNVDQPGPRYATQKFLVANPGWTEIAGAAAEPLANAGLADLPTLPQTENYRLIWEGIEGLTVSENGNSLAPGFPALKLATTETEGYHRLGIVFVRLPPYRKYRLVVLLAPGSSNWAMVDVRDAQTSSSQIFCDLLKRTVLRQTGPIESARIERGEDRWNRLVVDFECPTGAGFVYIFAQSRDKAEVVYSDRIGSSINFGGIEILSVNEQGEFERPKAVTPENLATRDLGKLDTGEPFGFVPPSFPDTKFFALKAPDGLVVSSVPRSFGSMVTEVAGARSLEIELAKPASGTLHYQIFCRAFSEIAQPEELTSLGSMKIESTVTGKVRLKLVYPLALKTTREHAHYRTEIILAFVPDEADGRLYLCHPPSTSESD